MPSQANTNCPNELKNINVGDTLVLTTEDRKLPFSATVQDIHSSMVICRTARTEVVIVTTPGNTEISHMVRYGVRSSALPTETNIVSIQIAS